MTLPAAFRLDGRTALVTGANRGLGRAFAEALAQARAASEIASRTDRRVTPVTGDVTNRTDVARIVDEVIDGHGRIDVLVNNAGLCFHRPALEVPDAALLDAGGDRAERGVPGR